MAVETKVDSRLQLVLQDGVDPVTGNTILKTKAFNNVKTAATATQLFAIATALVPLQQRPLQSIERGDGSVITEA
ncbi:DUF1659 domain-containing protein [Aquibacillus sp. 3ASR75-11]|uniref:DUF1659 domain-containing protein n=1 Tax=Terrihalobacillus insolitus TaxID=2950438 RepID=A0A9X3WUE3_9BACI|nr:DUF1659 domain-containing protein [Terrihalobacillus insolitus]MDC3411834.1 DUF1659 domain-containing protein [Terrihalobacillus insolitus]MDC3423499.1 DUF1659 domain-containing protein [Terrihalobacillus insolitus]